MAQTPTTRLHRRIYNNAANNWRTIDHLIYACTCVGMHTTACDSWHRQYYITQRASHATRTIVLLSRVVTLVLLQLRYVQFVSAVLDVLRHCLPVMRVYTTTRATRSAVGATVYGGRNENNQKNGMLHHRHRKLHSILFSFSYLFFLSCLELASSGGLAQFNKREFRVFVYIYSKPTFKIIISVCLH